MMDIVKVSKVLELFFAFNKTKASSSVELVQSLYDDHFFRWTKDTFNHGEALTAIYNNHRIDIFNTEKVRDRLKGNQDKISFDDDKVNFGCKFGIVNDLVKCIYAEEISEDEIIEFKKQQDEQNNNKKQKQPSLRYGGVKNNR